MLLVVVAMAVVLAAKAVLALAMMILLVVPVVALQHQVKQEGRVPALVVAVVKVM